MSNEQNGYVPGVCNIGAAERRTRRQAGWVGLIATVVVWVVPGLLGVSPYWRLFVFLPAMLGANGFLQATTMGFYVDFGMRGVQKFTDTVGAASAVEDAESKRRDRGRSRLIILYSLLISAAAAVIAYLLG